MLRSVGINNLTIPLFDVGTSPYFVTSIDGLEPPKATVNTLQSLSKEGSWFNSSQINNRYITINIGLSHQSLYGWNIDSIRESLYGSITIGSMNNLVFNSDKRKYIIKGVLESVDADIFTKEPNVSMTFVCTDPFFSDAKLVVEEATTDFHQAKDLGTAPSGFVLRKVFDKEPLSILISTERDRLKLISSYFKVGDTLLFSSMENDMYVKVIRSGTSLSLIHI